MNMIHPKLDYLRIRQLRLLVMLNQGMTLSSAAEQLSITAAAASLMLQELESSVGHTLFTRDRRGAKPTEAGQQLAARAAVVIEEFSLFEQETIAPKHRTTLRLGVIPQVMIERVPHIAQRYAAHYTGGLQVQEGTSGELLAAVQSGQLAAAIVRTSPSVQSTEQTRSLQLDVIASEQAVIALPLQHPLAHRKRIQASDLKALQWVLPEPGSYIRNMLTHYFQVNQLGTPQTALQVTTTVQALWCASQMGLAAAGPLAIIERFSKDWQISALPIKLGEPVELGLFIARLS
ncbi:MAG: LysR family transcriptional regulator [Brachymonas sp.]|nr:LysR family transcriptional regulator [Brachymonas sp.]